MRTANLGKLQVARIGLGAMGMSHGYTGAGADDTESIRTIHRALDLGVTLIDTAEIYARTSTRSSSARPSRAGVTRWCWLPSSAWSPTTAAVRGTATAAPATSASRSRARCAGSAPTTSTWTTVTSGEHLFAPHRTSPPGTQGGSTEDRALSIDRAWYRTRTNKPGRHYPHLRQLLDDLAQHVAQQIDQSRPDQPVAN
jgi:hypothetical protein